VSFLLILFSFSEANPLVYLPLIEEALQAYLSGKLTNEDHIKYLLKTGIPKFVVALLARDELVPKRTRLAELWMLVIRIIVKNIPEDSKELLITLTKLLNSSTYSKDYLYFRTKEREKDFIELMTKYLSDAKAADLKNLPALPVRTSLNPLSLSLPLPFPLPSFFSSVSYLILSRNQTSLHCQITTCY
jgi:hypothetical protein